MVKMRIRILSRVETDAGVEANIIATRPDANQTPLTLILGSVPGKPPVDIASLEDQYGTEELFLNMIAATMGWELESYRKRFS